MEKGKKGNGEDVIEGGFSMKLLPPSVGMASSRLVNISQAMAASRGSSGVHNWWPNWPIRVMASTISNNPYRCVFGAVLVGCMRSSRQVKLRFDNEQTDIRGLRMGRGNIHIDKGSPH